MRFASLASGSGGNCLVVERGATRLLLDCGLPERETERRLGRLGLGAADIAAIVVTHEHDDHLGGTFALAARRAIPVYLTHGTLRAARESGRAAAGVETRILEAQRPVAIGDIEAIPFTVPHDAREPVQFVFSDGASRLGVLTDIGASTPHVEGMLSRCDALVLECNHDLEMLWGGSYPKWLKRRIAGPFGHLDNGAAERLLRALDRSRLKHVIAAHLSERNNREDLARDALARALGCDAQWVGVAGQESGFDWRSLG